MEKITEAINRINILKLNNDVITNLQAGIVLMSDENGEICALDKGAKEAIEAIKDANVFVYHVLKTNSSYGLIYSMLYVSNNEDEWEYMEIWANENKSLLQEYLELKNGIPSHDTLRRVMGMINPIYIQEAQNKWNEMLNTDEGEKLKKLIDIADDVIREDNIVLYKIDKDEFLKLAE